MFKDNFRVSIKLVRFGLMVVAASLLFFTISCKGTADTESVFLEFAPGYNAGYTGDAFNGFDENVCTVLRCVSFQESERGITIETSKSKSMPTNTLFFVKLPEANTDTIVLVAATPVTSKEYEYDMTKAKFYKVTLSSAETAAYDYGLTYSNWQTGATNSSEKFPCCE